MASYSVLGVQAFGFPVDVTVTAPDGNQYPLPANFWIGVSPHYVDLDNLMEVTGGGIMMCQTSGGGQKDTKRYYDQVMTVDEVRSSV